MSGSRGWKGANKVSTKKSFLITVLKLNTHNTIENKLIFASFFTVRSHLNSVNIKTTLFFPNLWLFLISVLTQNTQTAMEACMHKKKNRYKIQYNI